MDAKTRALRIIRDEHATLTAVTEALRTVTTGMAKGTLAPDFKLLWSLIYYIEEYPELLHHPKEEEVLFPALRRCTDTLNETLDELGRQHANSRPHLECIKTLLGWVEADIPGALTELSNSVERFAAFHWHHVRLEEDTVLVVANDLLGQADWENIAAAFTVNADPLGDGKANSSAWFRALFQRIVYLVPPPWGMGPA